MLQRISHVRSGSTVFDLISVFFLGYEIFFSQNRSLYIPALNLSVPTIEKTIGLFIFLMFWLLFCPIKKYCNGYWLTAIAYNLIPCTVIGSQAFLQYHFWLCCGGVVLLLLMQGLFFLKMRTSIHPKFRRCFYSRWSVLLSIPFLLVSFSFSAFIYDFSGPLEALTNSSALQHTADLDQLQAVDAPDATFYRSLCASSWESAELEQRLQRLQILVDYESSRLGMPSPLLQAEAMPSFLGGSYNGSDKIRINVSYLMEADAPTAMKTAFHEMFHYYQHAVVDTVDWSSSFASLAYFEEARSWYQNSTNYKDDDSTDEGYQEYLAQPLEASANAYAKEKVSFYTALIKLQEEQDSPYP